MTTLIQLGRVSQSPFRRTDQPTSYQVAQFERGWKYGEKGYSSVMAMDADGTLWNTTFGWGASFRILFYYINREIIDRLSRRLGIRIPRLTTEHPIYTMFRVGLVEYLLGACQSLKGGYPIITYGWPHRIAALCCEDRAVRMIFFGPDYDIKPAEGRAVAKVGQDHWKTLDRREQVRAIVAEVQEDLLRQANFMTTSQLGVVITGLLVKVGQGPEGWRQEGSEWTADKIAQLNHTLGRRWGEFLSPTGLAVHKKAKTSLWANAAGKGPLADALRCGLVDDRMYFLNQIAAEGGTAVHVQGGSQTLLSVPQINPTGKALLGRTYTDARATEAMLTAMEDHRPGSVVTIPDGPDPPHHTSLRDWIAWMASQNPIGGHPCDVDVFETVVPADAPLEPYFGVRRDVEATMVHLLRHRRPAATLGLWERSKSGIDSALRVGAAYAAIDAGLQPGQIKTANLIQWGVFAAAGFLGEVVYGRSTSGRLIPYAGGNVLLMGATLTVSQMLHHGPVNPFRNFMIYGVLFFVYQQMVQRCLIPMVIVSRANGTKQTKGIADHLSAGDYNRAYAVLNATARLASEIDFLSFLALSFWLRLLA